MPFNVMEELSILVSCTLIRLSEHPAARIFDSLQAIERHDILH